MKHKLIMGLFVFGLTTNSHAALTDGLKAYLNFSSGNAYDSSGSGNNGGIIGKAPIITLNNNLKYINLNNNTNNITQYINMGNKSDFSFNNKIGTISLLIRPKNPNVKDTSFMEGATIMRKGLHCGSIRYGTGWSLDAFSNHDGRYVSQSSAWMADKGDVLRAWDTGYASKNLYLPVNEWSHLLVTFDGLKTRIYINGILAHDDTVDINITPNITNPYSLSLGAATCNSQVVGGVFSGDMDEIRVYNRALTNTEITQLVNLERNIYTPEKAIKFKIKAFLQGAYNPATNLMNDQLRSSNLIPTPQPYSNYDGTEYLNTNLLTKTDSTAIVDWVLVQLRSPITAKVIARKAALIRKDGVIIDADTGEDNLGFEENGDFKPTSRNSYYVSVVHRNHLEVMTANPITTIENATIIDFTNPTTPTFGNNSRYIDTTNQKAMMWAGDANYDHNVIASGPGNDLTAISARVLMDGNNSDRSLNYSVSGYNTEDVNLDGKVIASGPNNDSNLVMGNIYLHPANTTYSSNYIIAQQIP